MKRRIRSAIDQGWIGKGGLHGAGFYDEGVSRHGGSDIVEADDEELLVFQQDGEWFKMTRKGKIGFVEEG